jgi:exodeoxyribonuclease VII small subunit
MSKTPSGDSPTEPITFEAALKRLETIVHSLEDGDVGLNEALERYEEGVKLLRQSFDLLERAERRIELLSGVDAEGNPITTSFDDSATFGQEKSTKRRAKRTSTPPSPPRGGAGSFFEEGDGVDET